MVAVSGSTLVEAESMLLAESVDAESLTALRGRVREIGQSCGLTEVQVMKFVLVVHELAINAVRHGGGLADVVVVTDELGLRCTVTDRGRGIPRRYVNPEESGGSDAEIPRCGLRLVRHICDEFRVESASTGSRVEIVYPTGGAGAKHEEPGGQS
jgi:anti-sigma regulatory factor (Ser/Thr protein kinase)